ncbi:MAG: hypothetical protein A3I02_04285 [Betaproteobacteria bacterium RIFCSPLOWO2_02_FULL_67_26]|nr:MAG: hypothetical protein A3I02_04285 [Betaproteobacteria bacterium RIFCSPLOWO2_02_FULL_67_26]
MIETELKLLIPPQAVRKLASHPLLKGRAAGTRSRLYSIYFDTPALDLWRQGVALRLRRDGRRWVQTVKGGGAVQGGLHQRVELEEEVAGPVPDFSRIGNHGLAEAFASAPLRARIEPAFVTDFNRVSRLLELDSGVAVEASMDRGEIRSGKRTEAVCELELELKSGAPEQLYDFALRLAEALPLSIENRSKAERGFALARGERARPVKARPADLRGDLSVNDAFKAVMWASLAHLLANERGMLEGADLEYLHQMRVALRRLRSALGVFSPPLPEAAVAPLTGEMKWLAGSLGPARDWDVFMTETLPPIAAEFGTQGELGAFSARCEKLRRYANGRARRALRSPRYRRLTLSLAAWLVSERWRTELDADRRLAFGAPVADFAAAVLEKRYGQARKRGRKLAGLTTAELHRLRIAIKKYRYAADFFAGLYERKPARQALKRLARLQDILGAMNDAVTVANLMAQGFDGAAGRHVPEAKGILLGWSRGRAATLKRELKSAWKDFRAGEKFW